MVECNGDGGFCNRIFVFCSGFFFGLFYVFLGWGGWCWCKVFYGIDGWFLGFYLEIVIGLSVFVL